jgi:hypothetical protein
MRGGDPDTHPRGPRHPPSAVGPAKSHTHVTRTGSRPAIAGCRVANAAHSTRFVTHDQQAGALGYVAGACTHRSLRTARYIDGSASSLAAPANWNTAGQPRIQLNSASAAATTASEQAAYLQKRDLRGCLPLKPAP